MFTCCPAVVVVPPHRCGVWGFHLGSTLEHKIIGYYFRSKCCPGPHPLHSAYPTHGTMVPKTNGEADIRGQVTSYFQVRREKDKTKQQTKSSGIQKHQQHRYLNSSSLVTASTSRRHALKQVQRVSLSCGLQVCGNRSPTALAIRYAEKRGCYTHSTQTNILTK